MSWSLSYFSRPAPALAALAVFSLSQAALAAGTDPGGTRAGTSVFNQAQVQYQVNGVDQTPVLSDDDGIAGNGVNATEFVVDRKLDVLVAEASLAYNSASTPTVAPGQSGVLAWTVTNEGNQVQDFVLNAATTAFDPHGGTDNFDATGLQVFVDVDGDGVYTAAVDTATFIDELDILESRTVFLVADMPLGQNDGDIAAYLLEAQVAEGGTAGGAPGASITGDDSAAADTTLGVEDVLADGDNANNAADLARDGKHSAEDAFRVSSAVLAVLKSSLVLSDPFTCPGGVCPGGANPKAIPGAIVEYTVTITNSAGGAPATNIVISDDLSSEMGAPSPTLAFVADQYGASGDMRLVYTPSAGAPVTSDLTEEADADDGQFIANTLTVGNVTLNAGDSAEVRFRVEIQ